MFDSEPLVSVVIPCYNHEQFVQDSIQSVIDQTYEQIELIIIDDGSKDNSVSRIRELIEVCEKRFVRFEFRSRSNLGLSATLNEALEWCRGKYLSPIASDDILLPSKTKIQVNYLEGNKDCIGLFGSVKLIDENSTIIGKWIVKNKFYRFEDVLVHDHKLMTPTAMLRLDAVKDVGGYNSAFYIEDWYMWLKLSEQGTLNSLKEVMSLYRKHDNNSSSDVEKMHTSRMAILELFKNHSKYRKALKNASWMYTYEKFGLKENRNILYFIKMSQKYPVKTTRLVFAKVSQIIK